MFPHTHPPPPEKYEPEEKECPKCGRVLSFEKTRKRRLVTPDKDTKVVEVILKYFTAVHLECPPQIICHFHFLRALGNRLFKYYERCLKSEKHVEQLVERCINAWNRVAIAYDVHGVLKRLHKSSYRLAKYAEILQEREVWFKKARLALRWKNGPIPLSTKVRWSDGELKAARKGIDAFLEEISSNRKEGLAFKGKRSHLLRAFGTIEQTFTENRERLLAPNVEVQTPKGKRVIKLERTNNGVEQDFRAIRRHGRRLKGNKDVEDLVQKEGVGLLLLLNMEVDEYVKTVYGSWDTMGKRFAEVKKESLADVEKILDGSNR